MKFYRLAAVWNYRRLLLNAYSILETERSVIVSNSFAVSAPFHHSDDIYPNSLRVS